MRCFMAVVTVVAADRRYFFLHRLWGIRKTQLAFKYIRKHEKEYMVRLTQATCPFSPRIES
jgi:hypothetical protein